MPAEPTLNSRRPIASYRRLSTWLLFGLMAFVSIIVARLACHLPARPMWTVKSAFPKGRTHIDETRGIIYQFVKTPESWQVIKFSLLDGRFLGAIPSTVYYYHDLNTFDRHEHVCFSSNRIVLFHSAIRQCSFLVIDLDSEKIVDRYRGSAEVTDIRPSPAGTYVSEHTFDEGWQIKNAKSGKIVLGQIEEAVYWSPDEQYMVCKPQEATFAIYSADSGKKISDISFASSIMSNAVSSRTVWISPTTFIMGVRFDDPKSKGPICNPVSRSMAKKSRRLIAIRLCLMIEVLAVPSVPSAGSKDLMVFGCEHKVASPGMIS